MQQRIVGLADANRSLGHAVHRTLQQEREIARNMFIVAPSNLCGLLPERLAEHISHVVDHDRNPRGPGQMKQTRKLSSAAEQTDDAFEEALAELEDQLEDLRAVRGERRPNGRGILAELLWPLTLH
jgi:hypothetical protein